MHTYTSHNYKKPFSLFATTITTNKERDTNLRPTVFETEHQTTEANL